MMKHASFVTGNSSAGIREAPFYGIPTVNVGTRQNGRTVNPDIIHTDYNVDNILTGLQTAMHKKVLPRQLFGEGKSDEKFLSIVSTNKFWNIPKQKVFTQSYNEPQRVCSSY
jgi:UDP-N-acetylglucosamine 2-epimerase (hydrolysing)